MTTWTGLTWDHPRGYQALRAAAPAHLSWDIQSLEGFEAAPIAETAQRYDLIVLDHPHLGEAVAQGALQPVDQLFTAAEVATWRTTGVGPSADSYVMDGMLWALPLDAATQVSARSDPAIPLPDTWSEAVELAAEVTTVLPGTGPHLFLTLCAIAVADGARPGSGEQFLTAEQVGAAADVLRHFTSERPVAGVHNPITVLDRMSSADVPTYCPHLYGYVNYARTVSFGDAPRGTSGRRGSVLGGTGIAFSARCAPDPVLLDHVRWLLRPEVQRGFFVAEQGQPGSAAAWDDPEVDAAAHGFYSATRNTMNHAWIRPRHPGAIRFQQQSADAVRHWLFDHHDADRLAATINDFYDASLEAATKEPV
ncbi:MAG: integral rane protein [Mycobacterium sp.]|nr:integral rane protein [Mycobacterium sp.]